MNGSDAIRPLKRVAPNALEKREVKKVGTPVEVVVKSDMGGNTLVQGRVGKEIGAVLPSEVGNVAQDSRENSSSTLSATYSHSSVIKPLQSSTNRSRPKKPSFFCTCCVCTADPIFRSGQYVAGSQFREHQRYCLYGFPLVSQRRKVQEPLEKTEAKKGSAEVEVGKEIGRKVVVGEEENLSHPF